MNLTQADNLLKVVYAPEYSDWLNHSTPLLKFLQRKTNTVDSTGKNFTIAVVTEYNQAVQAIAETGTLPTARNVASNVTIVPMKYQVGQIQVGKIAMEASRNNKGAFVRVLSLEMDMMARGMKRDINRQMFGDGTGALAFWTGADNDLSDGATVDDNNGNNFHHVKDDMLIDVVDVTNNSTLLNATGNGIRITSHTASSITATGGNDGLAGTADGDYAVRHGTNASGTGREMMGLKGIVNTSNPPLGNLQSIDRAATLQWQAGSGNGVVALGGADITDDYIQQALDVIGEFGECDMLITTPGVRRQYFGHLSTDRRYAVGTNAPKLVGGFSAIMYGDLPMFVDYQCDKGRLYCLDTSVLALHVLKNFSWLDDDGSVLHRTGTTLFFDATYYNFMELGVSDCQPLAVLTGINE